MRKRVIVKVTPLLPLVRMIRDQGKGGAESTIISRKHHHKQTSFDIKIEILEFERMLDPDKFLNWLHTVERVFDYKDILEDKKVKLVALRLRKYASR